MHGLFWKSVRSLLLPALLAGMFGAPSMGAAATDGVSAPKSADTAPSDADLASTKCAIGEERFLPGDYFYCLATLSYGEQHYGYAQKFFQEAAGWGSKPAQYVLGIMALNGDHQPVNRPLALAWLTLAAERPRSSFGQAYQSAYAHATVAERQAAESLLAKLRPVYADATAAVRAEKRYTQGMAQLAHANAGEGNYCLEGLTTPADPAPDPQQCLPMQTMVDAIDKQAAIVFDGWSGHVSVGALQQVAAPATNAPRPVK
ncbi:hypothetical protein B0E46_10415 [Rhodanobacter sp. B04]|uniref:hypothetical protein n=1 Tax=Rhodanobacter sp. B04 TaxID=1945860 RepID=UPI000985A4AA|nr:hypothetical protein [Rhodanobacter sp. B04]OOG63406.1 hypothetical protein B0E46_10415 [Rhodanobacter sp. B04]